MFKKFFEAIWAYSILIPFFFFFGLFVIAIRLLELMDCISNLVSMDKKDINYPTNKELIDSAKRIVKDGAMK